MVYQRIYSRSVKSINISSIELKKATYVSNQPYIPKQKSMYTPIQRAMKKHKHKSKHTHKQIERGTALHLPLSLSLARCVATHARREQS